MMRGCKGMKSSISVLLACMLLLGGMFAVPACAETVLKDGIEVTLSTDRENYDTFDDVDAKLTVKNTNSFDVENVAMEIKAPQGYLLTSDAQTKVGELSAGEVQQQQASMRDAQAPVPVLPKTGDDSHGMLWGVLFVLSAAGVCAMVITIRRQRDSFLCCCVWRWSHRMRWRLRRHLHRKSRQRR